MASSKRRNRKSFLGRLKPLIGRLRGKEPVQNMARSPTSVADPFLEPHQQYQPDPPEDLGDEYRLHLEDHGHVLVKEIEDVSSMSQGEKREFEDSGALSKDSSFPRKSERAKVASASHTKQQGQLLRDFSSETPTIARAQRSTPMQQLFRPVSPIRPSDASSINEGTEASAAGYESQVEEMRDETFGSEDSEPEAILSSKGNAQPVSETQLQTPSTKNSTIPELEESKHPNPKHDDDSRQDTLVEDNNVADLFSNLAHSAALEQEVALGENNDSEIEINGIRGMDDDNSGGHETNDIPGLLFPIGVTVEVIAPKSKYKGKRVTIIEVKKKVKVSVPLDNNEVKETWLVRTSLSHNGVTPFPPSDELPHRGNSRLATGNSTAGAQESKEASNKMKSNDIPKSATNNDGSDYVNLPNDLGKNGPGENVDPTNRRAAIPNRESRSKKITNKPKEGKPSPAGTRSGSGSLPNDSNTRLRPGVRVFVRGSRKYNRYGTVVKVHPLMVTVEIEGHGKKRVNQLAVTLVNGEEQHHSNELDRTLRNHHANTPSSGSKTHTGSKKCVPQDIQVNDWRVADSDKGATYFRNRKQVRTRFQLPRTTSSTKRGQEENFLFHFLQNRLKEIEIPLNDDEIQESVSVHFAEPDGSQYELVSAKTYSDGEKSSFGAFCSPEKVVLVYCKVSGPGLQAISLKDELEKIADYGRLDKAKTVCRLELLQSQAYKFKSHPLNEYGIFPLNPSLFGKIDETGNEGCGFICEELLASILGGNKAAKRACAIQVRGYVPQIGVVKGMLCKKRLPSGARIEIPPSMIKVGESTEHVFRDKAFLTITKNGVHPSLDPSSMNNMIGRLLNGTGTTKSFRKQLQKKKLSDMILRLWKGLGVPEQECKQYADASLDEKCLEHAFVIGLADPTNQLPPGTVFCPGLSSACKELFVTRSPCIESSDGRVIAPVTARPDSMSREHWDFLQSFPFGCIIFANPRPGETPMPVMIADGDLDGDLYFVCWNQRILDLIEAKPMNPMRTNDEGAPSMKTYNAEWLAEAQERMADLGAGRRLSHVIARLYNAAQKIAESSEDFMNDEDYKHLAQAYKEALKIEKHGGKVRLPLRLHHHIPTKCHCMLADTGEA